ncbi:MAG: hypothetical protein J6386_02905 [Candidatus Synoicihabitans palmerolidicus]|nr:hypothetical protein [Candidatus Synoicihabitans palmerolidicus]
MCRNQEILPVSASLFLRYLLFSNLLRLWDTLYFSASCHRRDGDIGFMYGDGISHLIESSTAVSERAKSLIGLSILIAAVIWSGWWMSRGWHSTGLAGHEFRQTQTALTVQTLQDGGLRLDYETPVLGKPWSIPMEFPLYQFAVVAFCDVFGTNIAEGGRWVGSLCFLLGIPALVLLGRELKFGWGASALAVTPVVLTPVLLFYARTVMIEAMAWALGAWFLWGVVRYRRVGGGVMWAVTLVCMWSRGCSGQRHHMGSFLSAVGAVIFAGLVGLDSSERETMAFLDHTGTRYRNTLTFNRSVVDGVRRCGES